MEEHVKVAYIKIHKSFYSNKQTENVNSQAFFGIIYEIELWNNLVITPLICIPRTGCTLALSAFCSPLMETVFSV